MLPRKIWTVLVYLLAQNCYALIEGINYESEYFSKVMPFYRAGQQGDFLADKDKVQIRYVRVQQVKDAPVVVLLPARGVAGLAYAETIYDLNAALSGRLTIYVLDHRGQGASQRLTSRHDMQYVDHFNDYVDDLTQFMQTIVKPENSGAKVFLLGESMGGAVASLYAKDNSGDVQGMILTSPMFGLPFSSWQAGVVIGAGFFAKKRYIPGQGDFVPKAAKDTMITSSDLRQDTINKVYAENPGLSVGGVSFGWFIEAYKVTLKLTGKFILPVETLVLQAEKDRVVSNVAQDAVCTRSATRCTKEVILGAEHLILRDKDEFRDKALQAMATFLIERDSILK